MREFQVAERVNRGQERFFLFLTRHGVGDVVTEADIVSATGWKASTLRTYRAKNYTDPFLTRVSSTQYRVLRDGRSLSRADVSSSFTQMRPGVLVLTEGTNMAGRLGRYTLIEEIGRGAVAHVWSARSQVDERRAVKIMMPRQDLLDPKVLKNVGKRFARESRNGMELKHRHVVTCRDVGVVKSNPFLVMDCADESLHSRLARGPIDVRQSLHVVTCCLSGLGYLHEKGCIHRDIKPHNILRFRERWVLGDLGIVQWSDMSEEFTSAATITRSSMQLGSWYYMSPEQRRSPHDVGARSDVYALGITWYQMLTSRAPDPAEAGAGVVPPPTEIDPINNLILDMIRFQAADRPTVDKLARMVGDLSS